MMSSSKIDVLDAIAKYFVSLSNEPSRWYSLNTDRNDVFHLSHQFGMEYNDYQALLVGADLATFIDGKVSIL